MYKEKEVVLWQALTPLHVGGNFEFSVVDQPIQREGHTGFPKIESSSLKGSLRHHLVKTAASESDIKSLFGSADADAASAIALSDARLLLFPVRSAKGIFAYVTSPYIIERFQKELSLFASESEENLVSFEQIPAVCDEASAVLIKTKKDQKNLLLEEFCYQNVVVNESFSTFIEKLAVKYGLNEDMLLKHTVLIPDDDFSYYVQHSTEITTRIRINEETGIVADGALFHEEYVPAETIFYNVFLATKRGNQEAAHWMKQFKDLLPPVLQVGGNATLGKGILQSLKGDEEK